MMKTGPNGLLDTIKSLICFDLSSFRTNFFKSSVFFFCIIHLLLLIRSTNPPDLSRRNVGSRWVSVGRLWTDTTTCFPSTFSLWVSVHKLSTRSPLLAKSMDCPHGVRMTLFCIPAFFDHQARWDRARQGRLRRWINLIYVDWLPT